MAAYMPKLNKALCFLLCLTLLLGAVIRFPSSEAEASGTVAVAVVGVFAFVSSLLGIHFLSNADCLRSSELWYAGLDPSSDLKTGVDGITYSASSLDLSVILQMGLQRYLIESIADFLNPDGVTDHQEVWDISPFVNPVVVPNSGISYGYEFQYYESSIYYNPDYIFDVTSMRDYDDGFEFAFLNTSGDTIFIRWEYSNPRISYHIDWPNGSTSTSSSTKIGFHLILDDRHNSGYYITPIVYNGSGWYLTNYNVSDIAKLSVQPGQMEQIIPVYVEPDSLTDPDTIGQSFDDYLNSPDINGFVDLDSIVPLDNIISGEGSYISVPQSDVLYDTGVLDHVSDSSWWSELMQRLSGIGEGIRSIASSFADTLFDSAPIKNFFQQIPNWFNGNAFNFSSIWHYVVDWIASLSSWLTQLFAVWQLLPYAMVVPVYAAAVIVIVLTIFKRFFQG